jgi:hypothetical protein
MWRSSSPCGASAVAVCRRTPLWPVPDLYRRARFAVEFLRRNPAWLLGLTTAQWFSLASVALGVYVLRRVGAVTSPVCAQRRPLDAEAHRSPARSLVM